MERDRLFAWAYFELRDGARAVHDLEAGLAPLAEALNGRDQWRIDVDLPKLHKFGVADERIAPPLGEPGEQCLAGEHPAELAELQGEAARVLAGRVPTSEDVPRLPHSRRVLKETLRLYPPAWMLGRESRTEDVIGGHPIPAGAILSISPYTMHRQGASWPSPATFDPRRFDRAHAPPPPPFAYFPFGGGTRICPAAHLSIPMLQIALAMVVQRFAFRPVATVRTFAQIVAHVADDEMGWCAQVLGEPRKQTNFEKNLTSRADILKAIRDAVGGRTEVQATRGP